MGSFRQIARQTPAVIPSFPPPPPTTMGSQTLANEFLTEQSSKLRLSATLEINERVQERLNRGKQVVHLGFGEATFPLQKDVLEAHRVASQDTSYVSVAGLATLRKVSHAVLSRPNSQRVHS